MTRLEVDALGTFRVRIDGHAVTEFPSGNGQALLLRLLLEPDKAVRREVLATLMWPEADERRAMQSLRQTLRRLKLALGLDGDVPSWLDVSRTMVRVSPDAVVALDVDAFRAAVEVGDLARASDLYRGDLAPGLDCGSPSYSWWLAAEREDLQRLAMHVLDTLGRDAVDHGDHVAASAIASRQLSIAPLHEPAHRLRIRALALAGDRHGALAHLAACEALLTDSLGVPPSPDTVALGAAIRAGELVAPTRVVTVREPIRGPAAEPFVGRVEEFAQLVDTSKQVVQTRRLRLSLVTGPAGIGKTRLVDQFLVHSALDGRDVMRGGGARGSSSTPFQLLTETLRPRVDRENAPDDLLDDVWLAQLARLLPELHERYPDLAQPTSDEAIGLGHLREAVARLVLSLAQRGPTTLVLDDLHFADDASLDALSHAIRRWGQADAPIHLVLTARPEGLTTRVLARWLADAHRDAVIQRVELVAFTRTETAAMVTAGGAGHEAPDGFAMADLVTWVHRNTAGHPLLVAESLRVLAHRDVGRQALTVRDVPADNGVEGQRRAVVAGLRRVVDAWLTDLSAHAEQVLTAASVLDRAATEDYLRDVTGTGADEVATAIDELLRTGLLAPGDRPGAAYAFTHDLVADVVRDRAGAARRRLLHGRCLVAMQRRGAPSIDALPHALETGQWAHAIGLGIDAGQQAIELLAIPVANQHFAATRRLVQQHGWPATLQPADRERLLDGLGRTHELLGDIDASASAYRALVADARAAGEAAVEARALCRLADLATYHERDHATATSLLERARSVADDAGAADLMAEAEIRLATAAFVVANDGDLAGQHAARALSLALESNNEGALARHGTLSGSLAVVRGDWDAALTDYGRSRDAWAMLGNQIMAGDAARSLGYAQLMTGRPQQATETLTGEQDVARRMGNSWADMECAWKLGHAWADLGRYGHAVTSARHAIDLADGHVMAEFAFDAAAHVHRTVHDYDRARAYLDAAIALRDERVAGSTTVMVHDDWAESELAVMAAEEGDWVAAATHARRRLELRQGGTGLSMAMWHWVLTEALVLAGEEILARQDVDVLRAAVAGNPRFELVLHRCDAVLIAHDGDHDRVAAALSKALDLARRIGLPGEEWPLLAALADAARGRGDDKEADRLVSSAVEIIGTLAASIDDDEVRARYLAAPSVVRLVDADRARVSSRMHRPI
ncbi:MAG: AAA family ATPase [Acidimicrobiales bacterium]|nr:AAA family ATPase [Acidimicrobiales bacterium]